MKYRFEFKKSTTGELNPVTALTLNNSLFKKLRKDVIKFRNYEKSGMKDVN